ncbi:hypothetical protein [Nocardia anaemiae]|uniref:hypothetical protein n=1 Tax=Nocardia anaemiae TaxID=263910 RepID=UPI0007A53F16|nr:hypothetical protein [Nocardia anaemiae]
MPNLTTGGVRWLAVVFVLLLSTTTVGAASAGSDPIAADRSPVAEQVSLNVYSPAMDRLVPLRVLRPADTSTPRPTLYLLDGLDGGETGSGWLDRTDAAAFFADKNANVVLGDHDVARNPIALADRVVVGGGFESMVNGCTLRLAAALRAADVPARIEFRPTGTHAWGYWQDALHDSWPMFAAALGA